MLELPDAPPTPFDDDGTTRWGTYRGSCQSTDLAPASERLGTNAGGRFIREKRWQWFGAADSNVACAGTLFDAGYATAVFLWVFDRTTQKMIVDETELLPPFAVQVRDTPGTGGGASLRGISREFGFERDDGVARLDISFDGANIALQFDLDSVEPVTAICAVGDDPEPGVNVTQKRSSISVQGRLEVDGRIFEMGPDAVGMLDYTHGLLERETSWRWTIAGGWLEDGTPIGFNFVQHFNEDRENVVWLGNEIQRTEPVHIEFDGRNPSDAWTVRSKDGAIDLSLVVEGVRRHEQNFQLVSSSFIQPIGRFYGRVVDREVHDLFGIAESHRAKW